MRFLCEKYMMLHPKITTVTINFFNIGTDGESLLSYDVASESEITPCHKIDKPLVV